MTTDERWSAAFWDERYRSRDQIWSGDPNPVLVTETAGLVPGTALDVGAGEGGDAVWLAARGWRVTAADVSTVALERIARRAAAEGVEVATAHVDLMADDLPGPHDLVIAFFVHAMPGERAAVHRRLGAAVAPGGRLLIVQHDRRDLETTMPRPDEPELFPSAEEIAGDLGDADWAVETCEARPRDGVDPEGRPVLLHDTVVRLRRT